MPVTAVTETSTFDASVLAPVDGDPANGAEFQAAAKNLANRTRWLKDTLAAQGLLGVKQSVPVSGTGDPGTAHSTLNTANVTTFADLSGIAATLATPVGAHIIVAFGQAVIYPSSVSANRTYSMDLTVQSTSQAQTRMLGSLLREEIPAGTGTGMRKVTLIGYWVALIDEAHTVKMRAAYDSSQGNLIVTEAWHLFALNLNPG